MISHFVTYEPHEEIQCRQYLSNRKLEKYFDRETKAAVVCVGRISESAGFSPDTPFFYSTGRIEYTEYGLRQIMDESLDESGNYDAGLFVTRGASSVSPLGVFKVLMNRTLSFVSMNFGLIGDNAAVNESSDSLLCQALHAPHDRTMLIGAGRLMRDGRVSCGFALVTKEELRDMADSFRGGDAVSLMSAMHAENAEQ